MKSIAPIYSRERQRWALLLLTVCTFFLLLGSRSLNEPDEGRYSEIAREMIDSGDWLVPHFWYLPHFDKPPMTYWLIAASMKLFGQNEWSARLPAALAALSGVWAAWLLGCSIGGRRAGCWSVLILQTSILYFVMARMLTTDIFLTQFVAWSVYFFWRSWLCLRDSTKGTSPKYFWAWHLAGWFAIALGFLTKGPIALAIPLVAVLTPTIFRWKTFSHKRLLLVGLLSGLAFFFILAAPWFLAVNQRIPHTLDYMLFHQAVGHALGTAIKSRRGFPGYFFVIGPLGLLPWSWLLGWLWRSAHWKKMSILQQDGWVMLNTWAIFTFTVFSLTHSKLPAYILPMFPAMAVMLAVRFFGEVENKEVASAPNWIWRVCASSPFLVPIAFAIALSHIYYAVVPRWMNWQAPVAVVAAVGVFLLAKKWHASQHAAVAVGAGIFSLLVVAKEAPLFETDFKTNQTLKPFARLLQGSYHSGDAVVCWGQLPEGLPFYSDGVISATNRPFFAGMNLTRVPFEFTGNKERLGPLLLPDNAFAQLIAGDKRILVIAEQKTTDRLQKLAPSLPLRLVGRSGNWQLFSNR